jgi:hypothetical protein
MNKIKLPKFPMTLQVVIASIVVGFIFNSIIGMICSKIEFTMINHNYIGWALYVIVYGLSLDRIHKSVKENTGQLFIKTLPGFDSTPDIKKADEIKRPSKQIALLEGEWLIWPWYKEAGDAISLVKTVPIKVEIDSAQTNDKQLVTVKIIAAMTAIPGENLVWHNRSDESAAEKLFAAQIRIEAEKIIKSSDSENILSNPIETFKDLKDLFGGEMMSSQENRTGRYISNVSIESVSKSDTTEELDQAKENAGKMKEILDTLIPSCNGNTVLEQTVIARAIGAQLGSQTNLTINSGKK